MSRNASGQYSQPANTAAVSGQTASSSAFNTLITDIGSALTDSLDRTGKGSMQAQFKASDGSEALPGITFANQTSTGIYRIGDDSAALVQGGATSLIFTDTYVAVRDGSVGSSDLVTNGNFSSFTGWSGTNWAQSSGKARHTAGSTDSLISSVTVTAGVSYTLVYTVSNRTAGTITAKLTGGSTVAGGTHSTNETQTEVLTAATGNTSISFTPTSDFDGDLDDVSLTAAPVASLSFQGDTDTGFRSSASGKIAFVSNGTDIGETDSSGINLSTGMTFRVNGTAYAAGKQTVNLLAAGMVARDSGGTPTADTQERGTTNPKTLSGYSFATGSNQGLQIAFPMPNSWDGGDLTIRFWWHCAGGGSGDVRWRARAVCLADGDDFDSTSWGSFSGTEDTRIVGTTVMRSPVVSVTPGGTGAGQNLLMMEIERQGSSGSDTLALDVVLIAAMMTYTTESATDDA